MTGPVIDQIRAASQVGLETLAHQIGLMARAFKERLKPAEQRKLGAAREYVTRRLALWRDLLGDEPELIARLEALAAEMWELRTRRGCSQACRRCLTQRRPQTKEAR